VFSLCGDTPAQETSLTAHDVIAASMSDATLCMLFHGESKKDFAAWKAEFRKQLDSLLGDSTPPSSWRVIEENKTVLSDHTRLQLFLVADGVPSVPVYLLIPANLKQGERVPGVLCVHGHGEFGNDPVVGRTDIDGVADDIEKMNYDYGLQFVRRGYIVVAPCMIPFGRRVNRKAYGGKDPCAVSFVRMQALGQLPITVNLRDLRWCIDLLQSRSEVAVQKIGCAGLSYGGRMTMMVTAIDDRIKVASISGALNLLQERMTLRHSCGSQMIPGLLNYGDYSEIGSLIAPRPCVWETGSVDPLIVPGWDEKFRSRLRQAYAAAGEEDALQFDRFEGGHEWSGRVAFPLFDKVLKQ
jgi:dienelactone hydrolase